MDRTMTTTAETGIYILFVLVVIWMILASIALAKIVKEMRKK